MQARNDAHKWFEQDDTASITDGIEMPLVYRVALVRSHAASRIGWHHHLHYEILFLDEGATAYEIADNRVVQLVGGQCMVIPPGIVHRGFHDVRQPAVLCGIMMDPAGRSATRNTPFSRTDLNWIRSQLNKGVLEPQDMSRNLRAAVQSLPYQIESFEASNRASVLSMRLCLCQIILELASHSSKRTKQICTDLVAEAIQVMRKCMKEPMSIRSLARTVGCSRAYLFTVFKEVTGLTPNHYWLRLRMEEAFRRVRYSDDTFTNIAMDCGFSTSQYFSSVFRRYWGVSPSECRSRRQPGHSSAISDPRVSADA